MKRPYDTNAPNSLNNSFAAHNSQKAFNEQYSSFTGNAKKNTHLKIPLNKVGQFSAN
jgi:hypothetical protein